MYMRTITMNVHHARSYECYFLQLFNYSVDERVLFFVFCSYCITLNDSILKTALKYALRNLNTCIMKIHDVHVNILIKLSDFIYFQRTFSEDDTN